MTATATERMSTDEDSTDEDRADLQATVRLALAELSPRERVRADLASGTGWDRDLWRRLCAELGLAGLAVPESLGGSGASLAEAGVAFHEAGAALTCCPLLATTGLALPHLLAAADSESQERLVPGIVSGEVVATVAVGDLEGFVPPSSPVTAHRTDGRWALRGTAGFVVDGASADLVLVPAQTDGGRALFAVEGAAPGLRREPLVTLDLTRRQAHLRFDDAPAAPVGPPGREQELDDALDVARALLACEMVGGAGRVLDMTVAYAKERVQFGRPIGSFQAVKQRCADLLIAVESARSAALRATAADVDDRPVVACVAHAFCAETYQLVASAAIQLHGGIGFTWEHDVHLYFKRARACSVLLGTPSQDYDLIAAHLEQDLR